MWFVAKLSEPMSVVATRGEAALNVPSQLATTQPALDAPAVAPEIRSEASAQVVEEPPSSETPATAPRASLEVLVVERDAQTPIADAEVLALDALEFTNARERCTDRTTKTTFDPFAVPALARRALRTDANGRVRIPSPALRGVVCARARGRWGCFAVGSDLFLDLPSARSIDGRLQCLELALDRELRVEAVEAAGARLEGLPVELRCEQERWSRVAWRGLTDASGTVRVEHLQQLQDACASPGRLIACAVVIGSMLRAEIRPGEDRVRFELPPTGSIVVRAVDETGREVQAQNLRVRATIDFSAGIGPVFDPARAQFAEYDQWIGEVSGGRARCSFVALGLHFEVCGNLAEHDRARVEADGPRSAGAQALVELAFRRPCVVLTGTMRREDGSAVASTTFDLATDCANWFHPDAQFDTDGAGRFRIALGDDAPLELRAGRCFADPDSSLLESEMWPIDTSVAQSARTAPCKLDFHARGSCTSASGRVQIEIRAGLVRGENDLGVLNLVSPPFVVCGRVVDERGNALAGAVVDALDPRRPRRASTITSCSTDAQGGFGLRADWDGPRLELRAALGPLLRSEPLSVTRGEREVLLRIVR